MDETIICRSPDLWFDEGSAVFQAENTQFRIHLGLIASNSAVFKDMMSIPHPNGEESVDGCVLIRLSDKALDVERMLKALYDRGYFSDNHSKTIEIASSLLRMGTKYMINRMRVEAIECLAQWFPSTLSDWEKFVDCDLVWPNLSSVMDTIALARETEAPQLLPSCLCTSLDCSAEDISRAANKRSSRPLLDASDQTTWFITTWSIGRGRLMQRQHNALMFLLNEKYQVSGCLTMKKCAWRRVGIWRDLQDPNEPTLLRLGAWDRDDESALCCVCKEDFHQKYTTAREEAWRDLPSFFNLPSWEELLEKDVLPS